jgi:signal peptidase I
VIIFVVHNMIIVYFSVQRILSNDMSHHIQKGSLIILVKSNLSFNYICLCLQFC